MLSAYPEETAMELKGPDTLNQRIARNISDVKRWVNILKYIHDTLLFGAATLSAERQSSLSSIQ